MTILQSLSTFLSLKNIFKQRNKLWSKTVMKNLNLLRNSLHLSKILTSLLSKALTLLKLSLNSLPITSKYYGSSTLRIPTLLSIPNLGRMKTVEEILTYTDSQETLLTGRNSKEWSKLLNRSFLIRRLTKSAIKNVDLGNS